MHGVALLIAVAALGVDYGWQPNESGQLEYIIQIEPEMIEQLKKGDVDLLTEIPEDLRGVKFLRIRIGKGEVPKKGLEEARASGTLPADELANERPGLAQPVQPPKKGANTTGLPRGTQNQGSRVLNPPRAGQFNEQGEDPPVPNPNDRFTDAGGINRNASQPRDDRFGGQPIDDQSQPPVRKGATRPGINEGSSYGKTPRTNQYDQQPAPQDRWTNAGTQWNDPDYRGYDANEDPRYRPPARGLPEIRRDTTHDPRYAGPPLRNPPAGYNTGYSNTSPLRDPDEGQYPPRQYDPQQPPNRQVDYREVAAARPPAAAAVTTPPASTTAVPTTPVSKPVERLSEDPNAKPWLPLTFTAMLLFASVGLNFYLGWIANGIYARYRALLMEVRNVRTAAV